MVEVSRVFTGSVQTQNITDWITNPLFWWFEVSGPNIDANEEYVIQYNTQIELFDTLGQPTLIQFEPDLLSINSNKVLVPQNAILESGYRTRLIIFATQPFNLDVYAVFNPCTQQQICNQLDNIEVNQQIQLGLDILTGVADLITTGVLVGGTLALTGGIPVSLLTTVGAGALTEGLGGAINLLPESALSLLTP